MWPTCIQTLTPFPKPLLAQPPTDLVAAFRHHGWPDPEQSLPLRMVALLGICTTDRYIDCPTMPDWHRENAAEEGQSYYRDVGRYFWCDFDLRDRTDAVLPLRLAFNEGDADCNDGTWGMVWQRDTAEVIAHLTSVGDGEGRIETQAHPAVSAYQPHPWPVPTDLEQLVESRPPFLLLFAHDSAIERLIGIAIAWCCAYR